MNDSLSPPAAAGTTPEGGEPSGTPVLPPFNRIFVVAGTTSVQAMMSLAVFMLTAIAPAVAESLGISESKIGVQISIIYGAAAGVSLLAGGLVRRLGACRTSQMSLLLGLAGCILATVPSVAALAVASVLFGFGYAMTNPSASHLLGRFAGQRHRNMIFSIKQTGVPIGGAIAGLLAPPLTVHFGWRAVPIVVGAILLGLMALMQVRRALWDDDRDPGWRLHGNVLSGLALIWQRRPLRWLVTASFFFSITQLSLSAFLVSLLVKDVHMPLVQAGLVLSMVQVASVFGRLVWGWVADRLNDGAIVLAIIGALSAAAAFGSTQVSPAWPLPALEVLFIVFGMAAISWNGVFIAEVARLSPFGQIGPTTGVALAVTFAGVLVGPSLLSVAHGLLGSYTATFGLLIVVSLAAGALSLVCRAAARHAR